MTGRSGAPGAENRVSARNALSSNSMEATARPMTLSPEPDSSPYRVSHQIFL